MQLGLVFNLDLLHFVCHPEFPIPKAASSLACTGSDPEWYWMFSYLPLKSELGFPWSTIWLENVQQVPAACSGSRGCLYANSFCVTLSSSLIQKACGDPSGEPDLRAHGSYLVVGSPASLFPASNCSCYFSVLEYEGDGVAAGFSHLDNVFHGHY